MKKELVDLYHTLYEKYGPQGWWPLIKQEQGSPVIVYHKSEYNYPQNKEQLFEICIGTILTQNTNWRNVEKALVNLYKNNLLTPDAILNAEEDTIRLLIRPAGYFNQKTRYLKEFAHFFTRLNKPSPSRTELLRVKGIGCETADSMLLYAWGEPQFVVDTYTKRILTAKGLIEPNAKYKEVKQLFESSLPRDTILFQEYHALLVEHAKELYSKR